MLGFLVALILLALLLILFSLEENWRGRRELARCETELKARGEKLDIASFVPAPVPDAENFAMAPLLAPISKAARENRGETETANSVDPMLKRLKKVNLSTVGKSGRMPSSGDYRIGKPINLVEWQTYLQNDANQNPAAATGEAARAVLDWLARWSSELEEFSAAANRRYARFPLDYSQGIAVQLPHMGPLMRFSTVYQLRASAALAAGDKPLALRDVQTLDRVQAALRSEPLLISCLVRITIIRNMLQSIWEGAVQHSWEEDQLRHIQRLLTEINLIADYAQVLRGERACATVMYQNFRASHRRADSIVSEDILGMGRPRWSWIFALLPNDAVMFQNQALSECWLQDYVLPVVDVAAHRVYPQRQKNAVKVNDERKSTPYNLLAKIGADTTNDFSIRVASAQVALEEAVVACALERFRLRTAQFPEALNGLVPDYMHAIPHDLVNGAPLRYRRESEGNYKLYSVGWNELDDGGLIVKKQGNSIRRDDEKGDWVWLTSAQN